MKIKTAERYGLDINEIADFMDDFDKSLVIETNYIAVIDRETEVWSDTLFPVKFRCENCHEIVADVQATEMEFEARCPECGAYQYKEI